MNSESQFPSARRADVADTYHGVVVPDPYRWLEDASSAETLAWVDAQNALTAAAVAGPTRDRLVAELTSLYDFPRASVPIERGGRFFFTRNSGLQNQAVL